MKRVLFIFISVFFVLLKLFAADKSGTTAAPFLKIPIGSRKVAMGEAYTSIADDPYALSGNIAGICKNQDLEISFSHLEWLEDVDYEFMGFTKSFFKGFLKFPSTLGFAINYLHTPFFRSYNDWGEVISDKVLFYDIALTLGYAQQVYEGLRIGISLRYINEYLNVKSDGAMTFNLGALYSYRLPFFSFLGMKFIGKKLDMGFLIENWGMGSDIGGYSMPVLFKLGFSSDLLDNFLPSIDFQIPLDNRIRINLGGEIIFFKNMFFVRGGYRFLGYETDTYTIGIGAKFNLNKKIIKVDLAYAPSSYFVNNTFNFTLSIKYPGKISDEKRRISNMLYYKGIYYHIRGEYDKAIELWKQALKINPDFEKAKVKIKEAEELKNLQKIEEKVPEKYKKEEYNKTKVKGKKK